MSLPGDDRSLASSRFPPRAPDDHDPVPGDVTAAAKGAFDSARPAKLAVLVHDSLIDADEPVPKHVLRFEHRQLEVELHVSVEPAGTLIQGVLDRPGPTHAALRFYEGFPDLVEPVEGATFEFPPLGHGLVRISLQTDGEPSVWTDWFRI